MKTALLKHLNKQVKLGLSVAKHRRLGLRFENYLLKDLPPIPETIDYTAKASKSLEEMYLNDTLGCCLIADIAHAVGVMTGNADGELVFTKDQIIALYSEIGGYVPGRPATDQGCDWATGLADWLAKGAPIDATKPAAWMSVDPTNLNQCATALYLFEALHSGSNLPDPWLQVNGPDFVWDVGTANPENGHAFPLLGRSNGRWRVSTWGMLGFLTDAALQKNIQELYVVLSPDMIGKAQQKAPNGFDWATLTEDWQAISGVVPTPTPTPTPGPSNPIVQLVDGFFQSIEQQFSNRPRIVRLLQWANGLIDGLIQGGQISDSELEAILNNSFTHLRKQLRHSPGEMLQLHTIETIIRRSN